MAVVKWYHTASEALPTSGSSAQHDEGMLGTNTYHQMRMDVACRLEANLALRRVLEKPYASFLGGAIAWPCLATPSDGASSKAYPRTLSANRLWNTGTGGNPSRPWASGVRHFQAPAPAQIPYRQPCTAHVSLANIPTLRRQGDYPEPSAPVLNDLTCAFGPAHGLASFRAAQPRERSHDNHRWLCLRNSDIRPRNSRASSAFESNCWGWRPSWPVSEDRVPGADCFPVRVSYPWAHQRRCDRAGKISLLLVDRSAGWRSALGQYAFRELTGLAGRLADERLGWSQAQRCRPTNSAPLHGERSDAYESTGQLRSIQAPGLILPQKSMRSLRPSPRCAESACQPCTAEAPLTKARADPAVPLSPSKDAPLWARWRMRR